MPRRKVIAPPISTIVEYSAEKRAVNAYPERIVSPPHPSLCCTDNMEQVGDAQRQGEWVFVYVRCRNCGYTVRRFRCTDSPRLWAKIWEVLDSNASKRAGELGIESLS